MARLAAGGRDTGEQTSAIVVGFIVSNRWPWKPA